MNVAFIPVRGGSKSIPLKNIKPISGKPLVGANTSIKFLLQQTVIKLKKLWKALKKAQKLSFSKKQR